MSIEAANKENVDGSAIHMDSSMSVLGKRTRTGEETMNTGTALGGNFEERSRSGASEIALAADLEVVEERTHWWNPELRLHFG